MHSARSDIVQEGKRTSFAGAIFWAVFALFTLPSPAAAQQKTMPDCEDIVPYAEDLFFNAAFTEAAEALETCLPKNMLVAAQKAEIYLLLARIHFAEQKKPAAAEALEQLFSLRPDYTPEPHLPPPFIDFVENIREIYSNEEILDSQLVPASPIAEDKKLNTKRLLLIGGGGLFAVAAVAIMSGGRQTSPDAFPPPPGTPSGN